MGDSITSMLMVTWILMATSGVFLYKSIEAVLSWIDIKKKVNNHPTLKSYDESTACKGPHTWDRVKLAMRAIPFDTYTVCSECGVVSGTTYQLNKQGLEVYKNEMKARDDDKVKWTKIRVKKQEETDRIMNRIIQSHVELLGSNVHENVKVLQQFFRKSNMEIEDLCVRLSKESDK